MGALVYTFIRAAADGWDDGVTRISLLVAAVFLIAFVVTERRVEQPITPLHLFSERTKAGAFLTTLFLTGAMFSVLFLVTQFLQQVLDLSPTRAGLAFLPMTLAQFGMVRTVPKLLPTMGPKRILLAGSALITVGMVWLAQISVDSEYLTFVFGPLLLIGIGVGVSFPTLNMAVLSRVAPAESGAASGLLQAIQWHGGTLGLAVWVTVMGFAARRAEDDAVGGPEEQAEYVLSHGVAAGFVAAAISALCGLAVVLLTFRSEPKASREGQEKEEKAA